MAFKGEESKEKALIIALSVFVVLTIGMGVTAYFGFANKDELVKNAEKATKDASASKKAEDWAHYQALTLKSFVGHTLTDKDQGDLLTLQNQFTSLAEGRPDKDDFQGLEKTLKEDKGLGWDALKGQPKKTLYGALAEAEAKAKNAVDNEKKAAERFNKDKTKIDDDLKASEAEREKLDANVQTLRAELAKTIATHSDQFLELQKLKEKLDSLNEDLQKAVVRANYQRDALGKKLQKKLADIQVNYDKLKAEAAQYNPLDYDQPKGKIVNVGRGTLAYISLGSADNVKPQLTFSIFGMGENGKPEKERKGALEVVSVIDAHMSKAAITELRDGNSDPVLSGDLLYNPVWSSNLKQHVAIAGIIDLTGEGKDGGAEFRRSLEGQGIIVDAYVDAKDMTIKGDGMTLKTNFLVLGDQPQANEASALQESSVQANRIKDFAGKMAEMQEDAKSKGVAIIPLHRFLAVIGFRTPKVIQGAGHEFYAAPTSRPAASKEPAAKESSDAKAAPEDKPEPKAKGAAKNGKVDNQKDNGKDAGKKDADKDKQNKDDDKDK